MFLGSVASGGTQIDKAHDISDSIYDSFQRHLSETNALYTVTPTFVPFDRYLGRLTAATINYTVSGQAFMQDQAVGGTPFAIGTISTSLSRPKQYRHHYDIESGNQRLVTGVPNISGTANASIAAATGADNYSIGDLSLSVTLQQGLYPLVVNPTVNVDATLTYTYDNSPGKLTAPTTVDFGYNLVGVTSTQNVTVTNAGGLPTKATFSQAFQSSAFAPATSSSPINIFGGDSFSRPYTHTGTVRGPDAGFMVAYDSANNPTEVILQATSVAPVASLSSSKLDFGNVRVGTTTSNILGVYNNGDGSLANARAMPGSLARM